MTVEKAFFWMPPNSTRQVWNRFGLFKGIARSLPFSNFRACGFSGVRPLTRLWVLGSRLAARGSRLAARGSRRMPRASERGVGVRRPRHRRQQPRGLWSRRGARLWFCRDLLSFGGIEFLDAACQIGQKERMVGTHAEHV